MRYIIEIDDTDNHESRCTCHRAHMTQLGLMESSLCKLEKIARGQLFVSPRVPFTSYNSSASLVVSGVTDLADLVTYCRDFLLFESAENL